MAITYVWPLTLPQGVGKDYNETGGVLILRTPVDKGPAKQRRTGKKPEVLNVSFQMTYAQVELFKTFVYNTIRGTSRFGFPHPRLQNQVEVRIIPEGDGKLFTLSYLSPTLWQVSMNLEVLP